MVLASTSVEVVEQFPPNGCCQCLCPQSEPQLPLASLGDSPRLAGGSDQRPFKLFLLPFILKHVRVCMYPLRGYFSQLSETPTSKPTWPSKPSTLETFPGAGPLDWEPQCVAKIGCHLGKTSAMMIILLLCFAHLGVWFCFLTFYYIYIYLTVS